MPRKLLIVDDDVHIRRLIRIYLRDGGYELADTGTGEEALELAAKESFDVVLVDLILPYFGGFRLCQKLKSATGAPPFVVIITGDDSEETRQSAVEYGADAFLAKPFTREALMSALSAART